MADVEREETLVPRGLGYRKTLVTLFVSVVAAAFAVQQALAASCFVDGEGGATYGTLCCNVEVPLDLNYINESDWDGNLAYNANRYDGNWVQTYHLYVSSGPHSYGTAGNAWRRTTIQRGGYSGMNDWYALEYQIC